MNRSPFSSSADRLLQPAAMLALALMFVYRTGPSMVDADLWHEMALAREAVREGAISWEDRFAFTPTIYPCVHHEWGAGMIAYGLASTLGATGIVALKFLLMFGVAAVCVLCARRGGANLALLCWLAPLAILMIDHGISTVRAQMYSQLGVAALLYCLQRDREGDRRWIAPWLILYVVWLNVHAGFLVGAGLFAVHWLEQLVRRQPQKHLLAVGAAMAALICVNPYGLYYYQYLWRAVPMSRPYVAEWWPLLHYGDVADIIVFFASAGLTVYAVFKVGLRQARGILLVAVTALAALWSTRLLQFYAIVWFCLAAGWTGHTEFGALVNRVWRKRRAALTAILATAAVLLLAGVVRIQPWRLLVPASPIAGLAKPVWYPVGAVDYLKRHGFHGKIMTPFNWGAYVMWKMDGQAKVSMDGRYEVAYPLWLAEENYRFFNLATDDWARILEERAPDVILAPTHLPIVRRLRSAGNSNGWRKVYADDQFELYARNGLNELSVVDDQQRQAGGSFP